MCIACRGCPLWGVALEEIIGMEGSDQSCRGELAKDKYVIDILELELELELIYFT